MKTLNFILFFFLFLTSTSLLAQNGTLRGTVTDAGNGETVPFATILVQETNTGTTTDLDGAYELNLSPGTYTLVFKYLGYSDFTVSGVVFTTDKVETLDIQMEEAGEMLKEIVVTAKQARASEAALATIKARSSNLLDGITSQTFSKLGDSNAGEALKRVTGVSVVGGKHVYVRGLGDRYTKTILNNMEIPGLDPDRNSFEMDLLPTNLIDNILVYKSFTPDLPGDFTGGVVDVVTKDFPESRFLNISVGATYNPDMHFNSNFIRQERSKTDFLGMDNGMRKQAIPSSQIIPNPVLNDPLTGAVTRRFKDNAGVINSTNLMNSSFSVSTGNQVKKGDNKYSYILAANYKIGSTFYENAEFNTIIYDEQNYPGQYKLIKDKEITGAVAEENTLWSTLAGFGYKRNNHKIGLQALRVQNGTSKAANQFDAKFQSSSALLKREILEYSQREVTNISLTGKHVSNNSKWTVNWKLSPTFIMVDEPDIRFTAFEQLTDGSYQIAPSVGADISRTWRTLKENNFAGKFDIQLDLGNETRQNKIKAGIYAVQKNRDFAIQNYVFRAINQSELNFDGQAANIFNFENIYTVENKQGVYAKGSFEPANNFEASQTLFAAYIMNEIELTSKFKAIYGARVEKADNYYTGQNNFGTVVYDNEKVLDELNILPSLNLVYALGEKTNLRASYTKTVARPSFKEKSIAQIQDRISGRTFLGNIDLEQTDIDNFDLRYETFSTGGQTISISGFYKYFKNPIELESFSDLAPDNLQPKNIADFATVLGVEIETSKNLGFINESLNSMSAGLNLTLVKSEVERSNADELPEGEGIRPMVGQSPYIVNANIGYKGVDNGWEIYSSYNVQGKSLYVSGFGSSADVYAQAFHSLNLKASKKFGPFNRYKFSIGATNLLGDTREKLYEAFSGDVGVFERLNPGRNFSFGFSANLY